MLKRTILVLGVMLCFTAAPLWAADSIKIGVIASKTGEAASSNAVLFQTARFAVDEVNAKGGVLGRRLEVIEFDNQSTSLGSRQAAEQAVEAGVTGVIGASWSSHSLAMAPVLQAAHVPMISPISTNPRVTAAGDYIFRVCFTDPFQGKIMSRFARERLGAETAVVLVNVSRVYCVGLADAFIDSFTAMGGRILWRGDFLIDVANYGELLEKTKSLDPDIIYLPGDYRDSSFIIAQGRKLGISTQILGGDAFGMRLYDYIGQKAEGCYYTTHWSRDNPLPLSRDFVERYEAKFDLIKQTTIPLTYDAVLVLVDAISRAGSLDREKIRESLAATKDFPGVTGNITFDVMGDPIKPAVINKLENGGISFIEMVYP